MSYIALKELLAAARALKVEVKTVGEFAQLSNEIKRMRG